MTSTLSPPMRSKAPSSFHKDFLVARGIAERAGFIPLLCRFHACFSIAPRRFLIFTSSLISKPRSTLQSEPQPVLCAFLRHAINRTTASLRLYDKLHPYICNDLHQGHSNPELHSMCWCLWGVGGVPSMDPARWLCCSPVFNMLIRRSK